MLARLRAKALGVLDEVMDTPTPSRTDPNYARILSAKKDAAVNVVSASLKADENCFRQRQTDALKKLYDTVQVEMAGQHAPLIEATPG